MPVPEPPPLQRDWLRVSSRAPRHALAERIERIAGLFRRFHFWVMPRAESLGSIIRCSVDAAARPGEEHSRVPRHAFAQTTKRIFGSTPALFERMRLASLLNHLSAH